MYQQSAEARLGSTRKDVAVAVFAALLFLYLLRAWSHAPWIVAMDQAFFSLFDTITQKSWALDTLIVQIFRTNTAKMLPILGCAAWLAFDQKRRNQSLSFLGHLVIGSFLAMLISRVMQNFSAYRPRPLHSPDLVYSLPHGIERDALAGWSSFPSDTSALAFALAFGIFLASKRLGVAAVLWATVVVAFPRAYAGLHYPSDLVGGALIGLFATLGAAPLILRAAQRRFDLRLDEKWQPLLCTLLLLYAFQLGSMLDDVRFYGTYVKAIIVR